jgi:phosphohistidine phosphatase
LKKLIIIRHSKSSWKNANLSDFERPLNKRGNYDAQLISDFLSNLIQEIDMLHSSSSERTRETAAYFIDKIKIKKCVFDQSLYHISSENLLNIIRAYDNSLNSAMIIAHNPGLTNFVNTLTDLNLWNLPTTGLVIINFNVDSWEEIQNSSAEVFCRKFPKELK